MKQMKLFRHQLGVFGTIRPAIKLLSKKPTSNIQRRGRGVHASWGTVSGMGRGSGIYNPMRKQWTPMTLAQVKDIGKTSGRDSINRTTKKPAPIAYDNAPAVKAKAKPKAKAKVIAKAKVAARKARLAAPRRQASSFTNRTKFNRTGISGIIGRRQSLF